MALLPGFNAEVSLATSHKEAAVCRLRWKTYLLNNQATEANEARWKQTVLNYHEYKKANPNSNFYSYSIFKQTLNDVPVEHPKFFDELEAIAVSGESSNILAVPSDKLHQAKFPDYNLKGLKEAAQKDGSSDFANQFYIFQRENPGNPDTRIYINPESSKASSVLKFLVDEVLKNPEKYPTVSSVKIAGPDAIRTRTDGIVMYLQREDLDKVLNALKDYQIQNPRYFDNQVTAASQQVSQGISVAPELPIGASYNENISRLVDQATDAAITHGDNESEFLARIENTMGRLGIDPQRPYQISDIAPQNANEISNKVASVDSDLFFNQSVEFVTDLNQHPERVSPKGPFGDLLDAKTFQEVLTEKSQSILNRNPAGNTANPFNEAFGIDSQEMEVQLEAIDALSEAVIQSRRKLISPFAPELKSKDLSLMKEEISEKLIEEGPQALNEASLWQWLDTQLLQANLSR